MKSLLEIMAQEYVNNNPTEDYAAYLAGAKAFRELTLALIKEHTGYRNVTICRALDQKIRELGEERFDE